MRTEVVILNWNTKNYLEAFLPGVISSCEGRDASVVVADSASTDGSLQFMRERFPEVECIALDANYGFTGGYNRALDGRDAEYFILLNSDIEVGQDWLDPLIAWMDSHPECAACGPKLLSWQDKGSFEYAGAAGGYIDALGYPFCRGRVLSRVDRDHGQYDRPSPVLWATGACLCVRANVWKELGGLDDRFFAHMEEIDFCWRARLSGYEISVVPQSVVYHLGGGTLPKESPFKLKLNFRNSLLLMDKNLAATYAAEGRSTTLAKAAIRLRKLLDWGSALVYLLQGKASFAKAVAEAHKEYRKLRNEPGPQAIEGRKARLAGFSQVFIILQSAIRGQGVFEYLRRHEDSY